MDEVDEVVVAQLGAEIVANMDILLIGVVILQIIFSMPGADLSAVELEAR